MTLFAQQEDKWVKVSCTYGSIAFSVKEEAGHARYFWNQLGAVLDKAESEQAEQASQQPV